MTLLRSPGYIHPEGGWIIMGSRQLLRRGLIDIEHATRPSLRRYLRARLPTGSIQEVPRLIIHLRDWGEANYWHFLNDIIGGRLRLAQSAGLPADMPVLIGRRAFEQRFVQDILATTRFARMKIVVQDDELVRYREAVCFETPRHSIDSVRFFLDWLGAPGGRSHATKRVFLRRGGRAARQMSNLADIEAVCRQHGFETVRPETLSLREQMELFSQVRYLVAEHGAGLTNMAFRRGAPLGVLEVFPDWTYAHLGGLVAQPPPHYFWLARSLGFHYDALAGQRSASAGLTDPFTVDPAELDQKVASLLGAS